ncbi:zf-TFIIB domain-containing protein [Helicobacter brantae]|uniref:Transcription factor zinc-finger domain-containing protein n=1 Tax=Helicobacter brantae TaxID=375927 RepID=A0A3D8IXR2_9HELI|nr:zf-TFIIB domain-containing protein [Helicobacter brantae]RDU69404.1 hypothetical protein CQA58_07040 [Helicobacter brantae]
MKCPVCDNVDLLMSERSGVEIDYCPKCRGVWLDRGELDKIIANSTTPTPPMGNLYERGYEKSYHKPKKKESFLSELFDF